MKNKETAECLSGSQMQKESGLQLEIARAKALIGYKDSVATELSGRSVFARIFPEPTVGEVAAAKAADRLLDKMGLERKPSGGYQLTDAAAKARKERR